MKAKILYPKHNTAIVVGHTSSARGSVNFIGETEYEFNFRIARKVQSKINIPIICRPCVNSYSKQVMSVVEACHELRVKQTIHLHFNSFNQRSQGVEALIHDSDTPIDNIKARIFITEINKVYGIKCRGVKTIEKGHSGWLMLDSLFSLGVTSIIVEPVFGDAKSSEDFFMNEDKYVDILCKTIKTTE